MFACKIESADDFNEIIVHALQALFMPYIHQLSADKHIDVFCISAPGQPGIILGFSVN